MNSKSLVSIAATAVLMCIAVGVVYLIGCNIEQAHWVKGIKLAEWQSIYLKVLSITGFLVFLSNLIWVVRSSTANPFDSAGHVDMRPTWLLLTMLAIAESIGVPLIMNAMDFIPHLYFLNIVIGAVVFVLVYYVCSIFGSAENFKFAPIGAGIIRK